MNELDTLRLSVKRIAEAMNINPVDIPSHGFDGKEPTAERGWNRLCAIIINEYERTLQFVP